MTPTVISYDQFWDVIEGRPRAPTPVPDTPAPGDAYEPFAAAADE